MKSKATALLFFIVLIIASLACSASGGVQTPSVQAVTATSNTQATVDAAVAGTAQAQAGLQATAQALGGAIVEATLAALPPTAAPAPPVDAYQLSEAELEVMINEAVNQAVAATTQATTATTQAIADDSLSANEYDTLYVYAYGADQAIAYAEQLLDAYSQVYGELAMEALDTANAVMHELEQMSQSVDELNATLREVNITLQQGQELAQTTIDQLEAAAVATSEAMLEATNKASEFFAQAQTVRDERVRDVSEIKPSAVPADLQATLAEAFSFVDQVHRALGDHKFDRGELDQLAQLGANVGAGFQTHDGPKLQGMSGNLGEITTQLARGDVPHATRSLGDFERSLGQRPAKLPQPGSGGLPRPGGGGIRP